MDRSGRIPMGGKALGAVSRTKQPVSGEDSHILTEIGCICFLAAVEKSCGGGKSCCDESFTGQSEVGANAPQLCWENLFVREISMDKAWLELWGLKKRQ